MSWDGAAEKWAQFLTDVSTTRAQLRCSWSNSWYRGHENADDYRLLPTLLRTTHPRDAKRIAKIQLDLSDLDRAPEFLKLKGQIAEARRAIDHANNKNLQQQAEDARRSFLTLKRRLDDQQNTQRDALKERLRQIELIPTGEREAFIEYGARSGRQEVNSWEILAEMQHHGVPTRLLDWTETLSSALFFALRVYAARMQELWRQDKRGKYDSPLFRTPEDIIEKIHRLDTRRVRQFGDVKIPSVWILNPFRASEQATRRTRVWDLTRQFDYDYYEQFVVRKTWPFAKPIPMYAPWRIPRLAAQQGTFLVWGEDRRPADEIFGYDIVREVRIQEEAAVYGVYLLSHVLCVDHFSIFRDLDSLAMSIKDKYIVA
jgi:hypothetical protein